MILHGLLYVFTFVARPTDILCNSGSKRNWGSLCKALHRDMPGRPLYALDMRNHGASPHASPLTYEAMAADVRRFIADKGLKDVALLGHSMYVNFLFALESYSERVRRGGKAAMAYTLSLKTNGDTTIPLSQLIVLDIAPSIGSLSPEFVQYINIMQKIEALPPGVIRTRTDADNILKHYEPVRYPHSQTLVLCSYSIPGYFGPPIPPDQSPTPQPLQNSTTS